MSQKIEQSEPYVKINKGITTLYPITLSGSSANLSVGGTLAVTGTTNLTGSVSATSLSGTATQIHTPVAVNATATLTAAQVATGYITSTSAAAVTMTLPTGTLLGTQLGAVQGTIFELYIDNTAGASTVTMAVAVNGILSAAAVAGSGANFGLLTVPSGVTGQAQFTLMFSSATAYTFSRTA
jgi:hypothetical protein